MALITLRVLDGADRGRIFQEIPTPLTIGREEGNPIQLNDDRVSRFHLKLQDDAGEIVLTDLESTNGTKVNGETVRVWLLRPGDVIALGRTILLFGSRDQIAGRLARLRGADLGEGIPLDSEELEPENTSAALDFELEFSETPDAQAVLHTLLPPPLPEGLSPSQAAQLAEVLLYFHLRFRGLVESATPDGEMLILPQRPWQKLLDLYDRLGRYLQKIGEPTD